MPVPAAEQLKDRFTTGIYLDYLWCQTMQLPLDNKESVLVTVLNILHAHGVDYAVIGGLAVQLYTREPRTTKDIDLAIGSLTDIPRDDLRERGFKFQGLHAHTENWLSPAPTSTPRKVRVPIQFSYGSPMTAAVSRSFAVDVGFPLQLVTLPDLVELKLLAAESPDRQRSKRGQDAVDVMRLVEEHPEIGSEKIEKRIMAALDIRSSR